MRFQKNYCAWWWWSSWPKNSPEDKDGNGKFIHYTSVWPLGFINKKIKNLLITFSAFSQSQEIVSLYYWNIFILMKKTLLTLEKILCCCEHFLCVFLCSFVFAVNEVRSWSPCLWGRTGTPHRWWWQPWWTSRPFSSSCWSVQCRSRRAPRWSAPQWQAAHQLQNKLKCHNL